jgi:hypothetical protein
VAESGPDDWSGESSNLVGVQRAATCEVFLDPEFEYMVLPLSFIASKDDVPAFSFRLTVYSATNVTISQVASGPQFANLALDASQRELLRCEHKLLYWVAKACRLAAVQGSGCLYFLAVNGAFDFFLSLRLTIDLGSKGSSIVLGSCSDTYIIPPRAQRILAVVSRDGTLSSATHVSFRYLAGAEFTKEAMRGSAALDETSERTLPQNCQSISMLGDFLTASSGADNAPIELKGGDTIETYMWIPQLGTPT